jgi:hypothetical protein
VLLYLLHSSVLMTGCRADGRNECLMMPKDDTDGTFGSTCVIATCGDRYVQENAGSTMKNY